MTTLSQTDWKELAAPIYRNGLTWTHWAVSKQTGELLLMRSERPSGVPAEVCRG